MAECAECRTKRAADPVVGLAGGELHRTELNGVGFDEIEVEPQQRRCEQNESYTDESEDERRTPYEAIVDEMGTIALKARERSNYEKKDEKSDDGDAYEAPKIQDSTTKERAEARARVSEIAIEGSGNKNEIYGKEQNRVHNARAVRG